LDKNLIQRLITGSIFVIVLVLALWWCAWSMFLLFLLITVLGLHEFYKLSAKTGAEPQSNYGIFIGASLVVAAFFIKAYPAWIPLSLAFAPLLFVPFILELYRKKQNPFGNIAWTIFGVLYIALPFALLTITFTPTFLFVSEAGDFQFQLGDTKAQYLSGEPILFFVLIWISDSMAYVCGRLFGKHKLFERVSPKKTWEGYIGGLIFTGISGYYIAHLFLTNHENMDEEWKWAAIAIVISITGTLGDLTESLFKRSINVKDSGTLLPGHGGILDRFDAVFIASPFAIAIYWLFTTGIF
jgi:phosphatidate cytidylyltransferase